VGMARAADDVAATVGSTTISKADLEKHVKPRLIEIDNERFEALKDGLDEMVADELFKQEAKARNVSPEQLEATEITAKAGEPTDAEIQQVYDANKAQLQGQTLDAVKPRIVEFLKEQKAAARKETFINELKGKYKTVVNLKAPVVEVSAGGRPEKGPKDAPVTMIVFSDYECPFCRRAESTVEEEEEVETKELDAEEEAPEIVPLEEADEETKTGDEVPEIEDEEEVDIGDDDADTFLEEEEEEDDDVADIIGVGDDDDEV